MLTALCLGGGATLREDIDRCPVPFNCVVACNDAATIWPGELDAFVSLHPKKMKGWLSQRKVASLPAPKSLWSHQKPLGLECTKTKFVFRGMNGSGSSGLFMAKVALDDMKIDRVILCGVPLLQIPHFFDKRNWSSAKKYREPWQKIPDQYKARMRSMSGWSRLYLGAPTDWVDQ